MTTRVIPNRGADHMPVLHNCGPGTRSVYRTGSVGAHAIVAPRALVERLLAQSGVPVLPEAVYQPVLQRQLHPALIAAAAGVTINLAAKAMRESSVVDDAELLARLVGGRRALGPWRAGYPELALQRLEQLREWTARIIGGTRLYGLVRWHGTPQPTSALDSTPDTAVRAVASVALFEFMVLAYAAPPIVSFRRAPSLSYFQVSGGMEIRNFGHPADA